ncbi:MAG: response regulator [bacterium]|nr:response regulator [bacterium]
MTESKDKKRILLVDDEKSIHQAIKLYLMDAPFEIESAYSGEDAFKKMTKNQYNLIVIDLYLKGINGITLMDKLISHKINVPAIMITGKISKISGISFSYLGIKKIIEKPFSPEILLSAINEYISTCNTVKK